MTASHYKADLAALAAEKFETGEIDRRGFLTAVAGAGIGAMILGSSEASAQAKEIVVCNFGGDRRSKPGDTAWGQPLRQVVRA